MLGRIGSGACTQVVAVVNTQQNRNMATLKHISMRLKSVKNIQKITQSMKMVSAAKWVTRFIKWLYIVCEGLSVICHDLASTVLTSQVPPKSI